MLNICKEIEKGELVYRLKGRLDTVTAPNLERDLKDSLDGVNTLVLDFSELDYISSAGLRVLLSTQKAISKQGEMKLVHVNETIQEILDVTGFSDILTIE